MIKVYSTPTCPWCVKVKSYLKSNNIEFADIDVASNVEERKEMMELSGQSGVPVVNIDGNIIVGFNKDEIDKALNL